MMRRPTPDTLGYASLAKAICDLLAVNCAEMQVLRDLLDKHGTITKHDFEVAKNAFPLDRFEVIAHNMHKAMLAKARQIARIESR
jgi:hypothetical protein